jgi:hypothetical protein
MSTTVDRVSAHTAAHVNERIRDEMTERVRYLAAHPEGIPQRLKELDEEWDIDRGIEAMHRLLLSREIALGADRRWLILPALVTAFLFQHAVQGWCPPVPILRRLGFRIAHEIGQERHALKAIRGDFEHAHSKPHAALRAVAA